jgi:4-hydroxy-3-methylbut-2-en-1-yl diphosphate synthase IspG/GcpE
VKTKTKTNTAGGETARMWPVYAFGCVVRGMAEGNDQDLGIGKKSKVCYCDLQGVG